MRNLLVSKKQLCTSWETSFFIAESDSQDWDFTKNDNFPFIETIEDYKQALLENEIEGVALPDGVKFAVQCITTGEVEFFKTETEAVEWLWSELDVHSDWHTEDISPDEAIKELTDTDNPEIRRLLDDYTKDLAANAYMGIEACEDAEDAANALDSAYMPEMSFCGYCGWILEHKAYGTRLSVVASYARDIIEGYRPER